MFHTVHQVYLNVKYEILLESCDSEHQKGFEPSPSDWKSDMLTINTTDALCGK